MLTFLRKIRKSLIESGSARKYIIYATGEVLLVMIGILLALQVNNWNEKRLASMEEDNLYCLIHQEMELYNFYHKEGHERYTDVISASEHLLLLINDPSIEHSEEQIDSYLSALGRRWLTGAGSVTNIYDLLISSGKLEFLNSSEVKESLRNFNSHLEYMFTFEEIQAYFVDNRLNPYLDKYIDRISIFAERFDLNKSLHTGRFKTSYRALLDDREFANLLIELIRHSRTLIQTYDRIGNFIATIDSIAVQNCPLLKEEPIYETD